MFVKILIYQIFLIKKQCFQIIEVKMFEWIIGLCLTHFAVAGAYQPFLSRHIHT